MPALDEDVRLMLAFCEGDTTAFETLFRRWSGPLLRYLERIVRDAGAAEELVQEAFLRVHRARASYRPEARFSTWLYRIGTNLAHNELRRPRRRAPHDSLEGGSAQEVARDDPPSDAVAAARRGLAAVDAALGTLPEAQRAALWLVAVEGQSYLEVAHALDTTEKAVKALVHRARRGVAQQLADAEKPAGGGEDA